MSVIAKLCAMLAVAYCPQVIESPKPDGKTLTMYDSRLATINMWLGYIRINKDLTRNEHELAFVLGHELGHLMLRHHPHNEEDADVFSSLLIRKAGFDCMNGAFVLLRLRQDRRFLIAQWACRHR